jgi:hypothetical protein
MNPKWFILPCETPTPNGGSGGGGTTGTSAPSSSTITSGTASEALLKAAMASEATGTGTQPAGDTTPSATTPGAGSGDGTGTIPPPKVDGSSAEGSAAGARDNPELTRRFQSVARNARNSVLQAFGLNPDLDTRSPEFQQQATDMRRAAQLARRLSTPEGAKALWEELGQKLGVARPSEPTESFELPAPDLVAPDGKLKAYSADVLQKALEVHGRAVKAELLRELKPFISEVQSAQSQRQTQEQLARQREMLGRNMEWARTELPHFKEHETDVIEALKTMNPDLRNELGPVAATYMAYGYVMKTKVLPALKSTIEKDVRAAYLKDANASQGTVSPVGNGSGEGKKVDLNTPSALAAHMERMAASGNIRPV